MIKATISSSRLHHNLNIVRKHLKPNTRIMAILKANAYGHGARHLCDFYLKEGISHFGVARLNEALNLRQISASPEILILSPINPHLFPQAIKENISLTITNPKDLLSLNNIASKIQTKANIHIKVDTGMHRTGATAQEFQEILSLLPKQGHINLVGIFTHFADADMINSNYTHIQFDLFSKLTQQVKSIYPHVVLHAANSAAILKHPETHLDMVRPGLALHGINPFQEDGIDFGLMPTMSLTTEISRIHTLKSGESIGYNLTYKAKKDLLCATIAGGYADGLRRGPNPWPHALIGKHLCPVIGRVSMDQISLDISQTSPVPKLYQPVCLISDDTTSPSSIYSISQILGTTPYEIFTSISERVEREII